MKTLRQWVEEIGADRVLDSAGDIGQPTHWPWDIFVGASRDLSERGKCLHCENIYADHEPWVKTLGDLLWDDMQELWVCGTVGCGGSYIDWWPERDMREQRALESELREVKARSPKGRKHSAARP